jgi:hypothetical protein
MHCQKKIILLLLIFLAASYSWAGWLDVYKKGVITLVPDPGFGKSTDWDSLLYNLNKKIAIAPDGSIFISDIKQNKILKFDKQGNLVKTFGQRGQGPGDVIQPSDLSILDNRYLVVRESSTSNRRISIFHLDGRFFDLINSRSYILQCQALKNDKIAYLTQKQTPDGFIHYTVSIVDMVTKRAKPVVTFKQRFRKTNVQAGSFYGKVFIRRINESDLLAGFSTEPWLSVYSARGEKKYSFKIAVEPLNVSRAMKEEFIDGWREEAKKRPFITELLKKMNPAETFPAYVPYYRNIMVDPDGNILIFKHTGFTHIKDLGFQVYSSGGKYICDSRIDFGCFTPSLRTQMEFFNEYLYCLLSGDGPGGAVIRLRRSSL